MPSHEEQKIPRTVADRGDRLDSWKEIAAFLGRGVRTVQRWEEVEGLPVRRHVHGRGGTVFAFKAELQKWYAQRQELPSLEAEPLPATPQIVEFVVPQVPQPEGSQSKWRNVWVGVGAAIVAVAAIIAVLQLQHRRGPATPSILISQIGRISQTVYSPNGDHIVYCWNGDREDTNLDLYVRDVRTGASRRLTSHPNNEHSAAWSPSGDRIAFLRDKVGVFVIQRDGRNEQQLEAARPDTVYGVGMSWSADGGSLVYSERESPRAAPVLFLLNLATRKRRQITNAPASGAGDLYPSYSPDGHALAFVRSWSDGNSGVYIVRMSERGDPVGLPESSNIDRHSIAGLDWMPDGRGIVYSSDRGGLRRLWQVRFARWRRGPKEPEVVMGGDGGWQPSVARRTHSIIYSRRFWNASIWQMELNSAAERPPVLNRLIGSTRIERSPAYSPDGKRVAFVSDRSGFPEIWISDREGHNETQLTQFQSLQPERPSWSPDANWIAFSLRSGGTEGIYFMKAAGGAPRRLTPGSMECNSPSWSHDGQWVYCSSATGSERIWRVPVSGGGSAPVTIGSRPKESPDGVWLYFAREGALWRMPAIGGAAEKLIDAPVGDFAITRRGIYFDLGSGDYTKGVIKFYDHSTRALSVVTQLEKRKSGGLAISPDDRMLLFPINERQGSEVLLIREGS
jgi:eukaryotic-like serine/threonine-protein kinase